MSRISGYTTGNEGLDRSLADLAEVLFMRRTREYLAEMNEATASRLQSAARMTLRYAENAEHGHRYCVWCGE